MNGQGTRFKAVPYVSVAFTNRNDGYGGDLESRINKFIEYYAYYSNIFPDIFEFVICDWNPPLDRPKLRDAFDWKKLGRVVHVEVPPHVHRQVAGEHGRKMLDYYGRNVSARRGSGEFVLVLNQDIFCSDSIMRAIGRRDLSSHAFYRADRCDFNYEPCRDLAPQEFEAGALKNVFAINRRHMPDNSPISIATTPDNLVADGLRYTFREQYDPERGLITCYGSSRRYKTDKTLSYIAKKWSILKPLLRRYMPDGEFEAWENDYSSDIYYRQFLLHTNASGDFILAPRKAFFDIHGMPETTKFYMHLDGYAIHQLFAAGYTQVIFGQGHRVYHADHDRSGRADFKEEITWEQHEAALSNLLREPKAYQLNDDNWGLANFELPTFRI